MNFPTDEPRVEMLQCFDLSKQQQLLLQPSCAAKAHPYREGGRGCWTSADNVFSAALPALCLSSLLHSVNPLPIAQSRPACAPSRCSLMRFVFVIFFLFCCALRYFMFCFTFCRFLCNLQRSTRHLPPAVRRLPHRSKAERRRANNVATRPGCQAQTSLRSRPRRFTSTSQFFIFSQAQSRQARVGPSRDAP